MEEFHTNPIRFHFTPFVEAMQKAAQLATEIVRRLLLEAEARRSITTKYAPAPYKNCVDI